jgi:hypothetical protein
MVVRAGGIASATPSASAIVGALSVSTVAVKWSIPTVAARSANWRGSKCGQSPALPGVGHPYRNLRGIGPAGDPIEPGKTQQLRRIPIRVRAQGDQRFMVVVRR